MSNSAPILKDSAGNATWKHQDGDKYMVTGVDVKGRRFRKTFDSWQHARMINVYRGSKWLLRGSNRYLIQRVYN